MCRLGVNERVEPLDDLRDYVMMLGRFCARWAEDHVDALRKAKPTIPSALRGRRADNWRAMLAIAEAIGGTWPERARRAAVALSAGRREETASIELLEDVRTIFAARQVVSIPSVEIVDALGKMEDRPWPEWSHGKPLTTRQLAKLLEPFKIKPVTIRLSLPSTTGKPTAAGYKREDFADAFARYIPNPSPSQSVTGSQPQKPAIPEPSPSITGEDDVTDGNARKSTETRRCDHVTDGNPHEEEGETADPDTDSVADATEDTAGDANALEFILRSFRLIAGAVRDNPQDADDGIGGWPESITRLADQITDFADTYGDKAANRTIVAEVLVTPTLGISGRRGMAAHRYLWDRAHHLADADDKRRLFRSRPNFDDTIRGPAGSVSQGKPNAVLGPLCGDARLSPVESVDRAVAGSRIVPARDDEEPIPDFLDRAKNPRPGDPNWSQPR